jgi:peptidoglycan/LPS O-acetylase OafA/YrhL
MPASVFSHLPHTLSSERPSGLNPGYRPDVDGMRAIAALAVVGVHLDLVPGGFVGVDMFFVISGFLISGIILRALAKGKFSILGFYTKRVKRIFPALLAVFVTVIVVGWLTLLPEEYARLGREVAEGAGFVRDLSQYWRTEDDSDVSPLGIELIHLWSLGVEEQFYLLWPLFLLIAFKLRKWGLVLGIMVMSLSFIDNIALSSRGHLAAYFAPLPRLWELCLGGVLAHMELELLHASKADGDGVFRRLPGFLNPQLLSLAGTALILGSLLLIDNPNYFPGWQGLAPCLGTFLLIAAGPKGCVNRYVLSLRPLVLIGLISYPI